MGPEGCTEETAAEPGARGCFLAYAMRALEGAVIKDGHPPTVSG